MTHCNDIYVLYSAYTPEWEKHQISSMDGTHQIHRFSSKVGLVPKNYSVVPKDMVVPSGPNMESEQDQLNIT